MTTTDLTVEAHPLDKLYQDLEGLAQITAHLAAHADQLGDLWAPYVTASSVETCVSIMAVSAEEMATAARIVAAGAPVGTVTKTVKGGYMRVTRQFGSCFLEAWTNQEETCTRKVVGTETVLIPDPMAPLVEVERDIVEWDCQPILTAADARTVLEDERNMQDNALDDHDDARDAR